jgi:hypothetical protein
LQDDRWASSDDDWENIRLPGTNSYGNIDVREGVDSSLVHVDGLVRADLFCLCLFDRLISAWVLLAAQITFPVSRLSLDSTAIEAAILQSLAALSFARRI